jgi:N6-adenosine-specific RNA methylase IME4
MDWPFGSLKPLSFDFIMADPPWLFRNWSAAGEQKNASAQYACQDLDWIKSLPVSQLARRDCVLWLWATNPMLPQAIETLEAWGFTFKTAGTWVKRTKTGKMAFGTGYLLRSANEPFLIGTVGEPTVARNIRSALEGPVREHSRKPDEAYAIAEAMMPSALHRADLFSRQGRPGWSGWGFETDKFNEKNGDVV